MKTSNGERPQGIMNPITKQGDHNHVLTFTKPSAPQCHRHIVVSSTSVLSHLCITVSVAKTQSFTMIEYKVGITWRREEAPIRRPGDKSLACRDINTLLSLVL